MVLIVILEPGVSNTAAAAIWAIDYVLQATMHGVKQLFFHNGIGYKYSLVCLPALLLDTDDLNQQVTIAPFFCSI